jgi:integrase
MWTRLHRKAADQKNNPGFPIIPHFTPHDIRHTAASHLLMQGVDIRIIADILGHSTLAMIMRYTHLFDNTKREHIDKISYLGKEVIHE